MSIFKITLKPIVKTKEWKMTPVNAGRKEKTCEICQRLIRVGEPAITFLKRSSSGFKQNYASRYSCPGGCQELLSIKINKEEHEKLANSTDSPTDAGS